MLDEQERIEVILKNKMDTDDVKPAERFALKTLGSPLHVTVGTPNNLCKRNGIEKFSYEAVFMNHLKTNVCLYLTMPQEKFKKLGKGKGSVENLLKFAEPPSKSSNDF